MLFACFKQKSDTVESEREREHKMGKNDFLTPKAIANRMKVRGFLNQYRRISSFLAS
jgi:hypothetical protein